MQASTFFSSLKTDSEFDDQAAALDDTRAYPNEAQLLQLGTAIMTELLDVVGDTGLEDVQTILAESLIGAFHSAAGRIEREADKARDAMARLERDFDGSEMADTELQEATAKARTADVATAAAELVRDAASAAYTAITGEVWTAWRGSLRGSKLTAAQVEARQAIRAQHARKQALADPGRTVVAFRGSPKADTAEDAGRIFDALNWALAEWPDMALATTGAPGAEKLAIKWSRQKGVKLVLAKADFERHGKSAPFRANDEMLQLSPVCCLTLAHTLNAERAEQTTPFGPALNFGQKAQEEGVRHVSVRARRSA
ncbi:MAG TPA: DUF2493 domain-containing protein [Caulobacteraceae bacterium]|jgi:hypothetical protein